MRTRSNARPDANEREFPEIRSTFASGDCFDTLRFAVEAISESWWSEGYRRFPRARHGTFEPQLIPKHQTRWAGFDEKILSLYTQEITVREIQAHLEETYGMEVLPSLISSVTDAVSEENPVYTKFGHAPETGLPCSHAIPSDYKQVIKPLTPVAVVLSTAQR